MRAFLVLAAAVPLALCDCQSFGIDFQNGGSYFQNSLSTDPFTALQQFEGCQNDTSHNVIIDPNADQTECSETPLTPDDTPQQVNCPQWPKNKLFDGAWSLLIISNNAGGDPIAFQRDFLLSVAPQQTVTAAAPTISGGSAGTSTITPPPVTATKTVGFFQFTSSSTFMISTSTTVVVPASCSVRRSRLLDPLATIIPSILGELNIVAASVVESNTAAKRSLPTEVPLSAKFKRAIIEGRIPGNDLKRAFIEARRAELEKRLEKRAPDAPTITSTPPPVYIPATITAPPRTATNTAYVLFYITTVTTTVTSTSTATIKTTPAGAAAACSSSGGVLV